MTITLIIDVRKVKKQDSPCNIFVRIGAGGGKRIMIPTGCSCTQAQWVGKVGGNIVKNGTPNFEHINLHCNNLYFEISNYALTHTMDEIIEKYKPQKKEREIKNAIKKQVKCDFDALAKEYSKRVAESTANTITYTRKLINECFGNININDINISLLRKFDDMLVAKKLSVNTRAIVFRNIRAIINRAIDDEIYTTNYPFRKFKIKSERQEPNVLSMEDLIKFYNYAPDTYRKQMAYDCFWLSFYLCGLNLKDIYHIEKSNFVGNTLKLKRIKTNQSIIHAITPEANQIIESRKAKSGKYVLDFAETYPNYDTFLHKIAKSLKKIEEELGLNQNITLYSARYTWATIADSIGIDEKVISKSLGHADVSMAGKHYIRYDWERSHEANRRVIDYVINYNK